MGSLEAKFTKFLPNGTMNICTEIINDEIDDVLINFLSSTTQVSYIFFRENPSKRKDGAAVSSPIGITLANAWNGL